MQSLILVEQSGWDGRSLTELEPSQPIKHAGAGAAGVAAGGLLEMQFQVHLEVHLEVPLLVVVSD